MDKTDESIKKLEEQQAAADARHDSIATLALDRIGKAFAAEDYFTAVISSGSYIEYLIEHFISVGMELPQAFFPGNSKVERVALGGQLKLSVALGKC